ncbi:transposon Tf2-6 polyprotein [Trichonephila clavipes]|nr:transposon Tf2-6 polyprotein [Trichonephila clavipes]
MLTSLVRFTLHKQKLSTHFHRSRRIYQIYLAISVKTVSAESALEKLKTTARRPLVIPSEIISDRGSAFTSKLFNDYCDEENIQHLQIATDVPRGNGQVERIHRTLIPVLTKLSLDDSTKMKKKKASLYKEGDLVAIQRTQFGSWTETKTKVLRPLQSNKVNSKDRYEVEKVGQHDGPDRTQPPPLLI